MKRNIILTLLAAVTLGFLCPTTALAQRYNGFQMNFVDEFSRDYNMGTGVSLYVYAAGTTTQLTVYKDAGGKLACTQPITDNSTNTPLDYVTGRMKFYTFARSYKINVTDGTYVQNYDNLNNATTRIIWPPRSVPYTAAPQAINGATLAFQTSDWTMSDATASTLKFLAGTDGDIIHFGSATAQGDMIWYSGTGTTNVEFNEGNNLITNTGVSQTFDDSSILYFGTHKDFSVKSDSTTVLNILPLTTDETSTINFGANTQGVNMYFYVGTSGDYIKLTGTSSGNLGFEDVPISLGDATKILFGDALGTGDLYLESTSNVLTLGQVVAGTGEFRLGVDANGMDVTFYGDTASSYMKWDQDAGTNGELLLDAANIALGDGDKLLFGDTLGTGDFSISDESDVLSFRQIVADTGTVAWGVDNAGIDMTWYGESASAYMKWDATSADQLILHGVDSSGTLLAIAGIDTSGNSDTVTITHQGTGSGLKITDGSATSVALTALSCASQTTSLVKLDGATNNWIGADDVGMLQLNTDTAGAHTGTSMMIVASSAQPISAAEGFLARFVDTGTARTNAHAVEIETTNTTPALALNNQLTIAGADSAGVLLSITGIDASGNSDTVQIAHKGTGDAVQVTCTDATSVALNLVGAASQTTAVQKIDGDTAEWSGADDVGMLQVIKGNGAMAHAGATQLLVTNAAQPVSTAEGFMARFVDTGTARTNAHGVQISTTNTTPALSLNNQLTIAGADSAGVLMSVTGIDASGNSDTIQVAHRGTGDAVQVTCTDATSVALNLVGATNQTTALQKVDGDTAEWIGADDVGMVQIVKGATALAHTGSTQLLVTNGAQPVASAEGFMARFVDTGTARTTAHGVEIETTNTTPALALNNQLTITGADSTGVLLSITGIDTSGNSDTVQIAHSGTGDAIDVTCSTATSSALNLHGSAAQTTAILKVDGATSADWRGATGVGMVNLTNDGTPAHANATLLRIAQSGTSASAQRGIAASLEDTSSAGGGTPYVLYLSSTNNEAIWVDSGKVQVDETIFATGGVQSGAVEVTADAEASQVTIPAGARFVNVTSDTATKVICLPTAVLGNMIDIYCGATGCELQTLATTNSLINGVDCDGSNELAITAGKLYHLECVAVSGSTGTWIAWAQSAAGAAEATLVPDAD